MGSETESRGGNWRKSPLPLCKKGDVAKEVVEEPDVSAADAADAKHL